MYRPHYEKHWQIAELWVEEKAKLLPLPGVPFEVVRLEAATGDKYARIRFDDDHYDLPRANPGETVLLKVYWDRIEILSESLQLLGICGRPYSTRETPIDWAAHLELFRRKPRALAYSSLINHLPAALKEFFLSREGNLRRQRIELVRQLLKSGHTIEGIAGAVAAAVKDGVEDDAGAVCHLLYRLTRGYTPGVIPDPYTPPASPAISPTQRLRPPDRKRRWLRWQQTCLGHTAKS